MSKLSENLKEMLLTKGAHWTSDLIQFVTHYLYILYISPVLF